MQDPRNYRPDEPAGYVAPLESSNLTGGSSFNSLRCSRRCTTSMKMASKHVFSELDSAGAYGNSSLVSESVLQ
jgi:hypothetical protein